MRLLAFAAAAVLCLSVTSAQVPPLQSAPQSEQASELRRLIDDLTGVKIGYEREDTGPDLIVLTGVKMTFPASSAGYDPLPPVTIQRLELRGLDPSALRRVLDPKQYTGSQDRVAQPIAAQLVIHGMAWRVWTSDGTSAVSLDHLSIDGLQMSQLGFIPGGTDFWAQFSTPETASDEILAHIRDALKIDRFTLKRLSGLIESTSMAQQPSPVMQPFTMTFRVGAVTQSNIDRGYSGRGVVSDLRLAFDSEEARFSLIVQESTSDFSDDSGILKWTMTGEIPPVSRDVLYDYGPSCLKGVFLDIRDFGLLDVPMMCTDRIKSVWLIPEAASMELKGTFAPAFGDNVNVPAFVAQHFSQPLDFTFGFSFSYDAGKGEIAIDRYGFGLGGFGSIDVQAAGGGFDLETLMSLPQTYRDQISLISGNMTLVDEGGIAKILAMSAASSTDSSGVVVEPEALRLQAKAGIDLAILRFGNTPEVAAMGAAAKTFLDNGGTLVTTVTPPTPLKAADFEGLAARGPAGILSALGLKVEHTAP
jgi:hypothetical protein